MAAAKSNDQPDPGHQQSSCERYTRVVPPEPAEEPSQSEIQPLISSTKSPPNQGLPSASLRFSHGASMISMSSGPPVATVWVRAPQE